MVDSKTGTLYQQPLLAPFAPFAMQIGRGYNTGNFICSLPAVCNPLSSPYTMFCCSIVTPLPLLLWLLLLQQLELVFFRTQKPMLRLRRIQMGKPSMMAAPIFLTVVLLVVATSTMTATASKADVNIWNEIGENQILQLQCSSRDNHLGKHTLTYGDKFGWGFSPNIFGTTLFYCSFVWGPHYRSFVAWRNTFPAPCQHCEYRVGSDGIYRNERGLTPVLVFTWH